MTACGGDSSDSSTTTTAASLTLSGTAATGAALAGAPVTFKCATGAGSATTLADGSYSVGIAGGALPCAAEVTLPTGGTLHSLAVGSGPTAVLNLTPFAELIVARLAGVNAASYYANFGESSASAATAAGLSTAEGTVSAILKSAGIDVSSLGDLLSGTLKARTSTAAGDAYDQALEAFGSKLSSAATTLATFSDAVVASGTASDAAAVTPAALLQPAAANCSALRSGTYRVITPLSGAALSAQFGLMTINASTLAIVRADGSSGTLVANGSCRYTDTGAGYSADLVVSGAGVVLGRYTTNGTVFHNLFGFPEQTHTVAELAGTWNVFSMTPVGSTHVGVSGSTVLSSSGQMSTVVNCENDSTWAADSCASIPDSVTGLLAPWTVDPTGGFDVPDAATGAVNTRTFAYANGSGTLMIATVSNVGFGLWARQTPLPLPTVGTSTTSWNLDMNADLTSNAATYETTSLVSAPMATSNSPTYGHSNSPRQDGPIMSRQRC